MSRVSKFGFKNTQDASTSITPKALGLVSNYALTRDVADVVTLSNRTAPIDCEEIIELRSRVNSQVKSNLNIQNPAKVGSAVEYSVRLDATLATTDTDDPNFRVDEPMVVTIAIKHPRSGNVDGSIVEQLFLRAVSALRKDDGSWRFDDLMRSAERPVVD